MKAPGPGGSPLGRSEGRRPGRPSIATRFEPTRRQRLHNVHSDLLIPSRFEYDCLLQRRVWEAPPLFLLTEGAAHAGPASCSLRWLFSLRRRRSDLASSRSERVRVVGCGALPLQNRWAGTTLSRTGAESP